MFYTHAAESNAASKKIFIRYGSTKTNRVYSCIHSTTGRSWFSIKLMEYQN